MTPPHPADLIPAYARAGLPVLPLHAMRDALCSCGKTAGGGAEDCHSPAKHPLATAVPHGKDDATTDLGQIAEWLARYPDCNWGVRPPVGVIVLDVDPRNGGASNLAALQTRNRPLPATLTARTGGGGLHIWLSYTGPARGRLCTGVDVKTNSGYVVAPPSVHASGGVYEWLTELPAARAPRWVRIMLNPPLPRYAPTREGGGLDALIRFVATAGQGERNRRLYWAACRAHEAGLDPNPLIDAAVHTGLTSVAARATVASAQRAPARTGS